MRFLLGECLPPSLAGLLRAAGHDCAHVYELGLGGQPDDQIMALADVILANLKQITDDLEAGALIVISGTRIRTRRLPVKPSG